MHAVRQPGGVPLTSAHERELSFERFVAASHERAVRLAWRLTGAGKGVAEDLVQEALIAAYEKLGSLRDPAALEGWFYRILARRASNHRRWAAVRHRFAQTVVPERATAPVVPEPGLRVRIDQAMAHLSETQRAVFILVYLEGFTLDETARILGKAPGTVRTHLHRALQTLRRELAEVMDELR
ncbi:MAG: RNA polymerase sigma factor [Myxococcota bacterium]